MTQGKVQNEDNFLNRIAYRLGRERKTIVEKPEWDFKPQWEVYKNNSQDHLLSIFKEACKKVHIEVKETVASQLEKDFLDMINHFGGGPIVIGKDERFNNYKLDSVLKEHEVHTWDVSCGDENIEIAAKANIGISFSDITLAESGTSVFLNNKDISRSISLLPLTSIVLIPKSTLVPRLTQATKMIDERVKAGEKIESYINMVSGPSNSADIEMNLVVGVHGPVRVGYLVIGDR